MAGDRHRLLGVQVPFIEADRTVQPDGVVQAHGGERTRSRPARDGCETPCRAAGSRSRRRASRCAPTGDHRCLAAVASSATRSGRCTPPRKVGGSAIRISTGGGTSIQVCAFAHPRRCVLHPVLQQRYLLGRRHVQRRLGEFGFRRIGMEGRDRGEQAAAVLHHVHLPRRHRTPVAHPLDDDIQRRCPNHLTARSTRARECGSWSLTVAEAACMACASSWPPKTRPKRLGSLCARNRLSPAVPTAERARDCRAHRGSPFPSVRLCHAADLSGRWCPPGVRVEMLASRRSKNLESGCTVAQYAVANQYRTIDTGLLTVAG